MTETRRGIAALVMVAMVAAAGALALSAATADDAIAGARDTGNLL